MSVSSHGNYGDLGTYDLSIIDLPAGWASADAFRFAWQRLSGDGSIVARVTGNQNTHGWAKAGVEIRESLAANSMHVAMVTTTAQGPQLISRATTGGSSTTVNGTAAAFTTTWVRLVRAGNVITAFRSADGVSWTTVGSATVSMGGAVYIRLLSSSNTAATINEATFTSVSRSGRGAARLLWFRGSRSPGRLGT